ncbi:MULTISPECIES: sulfite exporter TauE/SafE family protein [Shewanella]|uniref:sulfite exporter TauE/SafE family protein n=1 Tax=Shewanella TaxID=22 RepID=UPI0004AD525B|nr:MULTISPECIES: sulfite exporter TauE/SafE family protein [Shewanella]QLE84664.1 sulfite exporter TauE/SafE family protein [Shewanella sp. Scap07]
MIRKFNKIKDYQRHLILLAGLVSIWFIWAMQFTDTLDVIKSYLHYVMLGITGAIFANSTGAGGGVIFIPVFNSLELSHSQSVSTSFAIQCFGMTAGSIAWWRHFKQAEFKQSAQLLPILVGLCAPVSIMGIWCAELLSISAPASLELSFSLFSIILGIAIVYSGLRPQKQHSTRSLTPLEVSHLIILSFVGGLITAWLSVGVGEILVIYLILSRFSPTLAVAVGVMVTAITVWSVSPIHLNPSSDAYFNIVLFAGPGAILGGILAKKLALYLPVRSLKLFFAFWIIISGIHMYP